MMAWITIIALWALVGACIVWLSVESAEDVRTRRAEDDASNEISRAASNCVEGTSCPCCGQKWGGR
jgi:hypothetical protein